MAPGGLRRTHCVLCGGTDLRPTLELRDRWLLTCSECGVRLTDTYAEGAVVADYYTDVQAHHGKLGGALAQQEGALRAIARDQADALERLCGPRRFGRFLEVGCSRGHLLHEMQTRGWGVDGIDVSRTSTSAASELIDGPVHCGTPEDAGFARGTFDRVALFDVLAHLPDPRRTLEATVKMMKPGASLVLSTVDEDWRLVPLMLRAFRVAPERTAPLREEMYEGQHYCYFSASNVGRMLKSVGLQMHEVRPIEPLSTRFFVHQYSARRRLMLLGMVQLDRVLRSSRKMLVLAKKPGRAF
jgi:SAM-dependent methyltransferase